jgi:CRISPR type III-B/RAMP module RAMP protein Cmr1
MAVESIEFKIKFITPLFIHGANSREADSIGLTGKALRGCWRFWSRALVTLFVIPAVSKRESRIENIYG